MEHSLSKKTCDKEDIYEQIKEILGKKKKINKKYLYYFHS